MPAKFSVGVKLLLAIPYRILTKVLGLDIVKTKDRARGFVSYVQDWISYNKLNTSGDFFNANLNSFLVYPTLTDRYDSAGTAKGEYFFQDLWFAKKIFKASPTEHWDIGSRVDGFISHLLVFRPVNVIDIRELESTAEGLTFHKGDITSLEFSDNSLSSLSSLHTVEHIGLGRYGDPVDPLGCFKAMQELRRVLAPDGKLYFSVPIGVERVEFNAHRVFDPSTVIEQLSDLTLVDFAVVHDGQLIENADWRNYRETSYSCGLFVFSK
jgi:SAM-dependent methyltransferase